MNVDASDEDFDSSEADTRRRADLIRRARTEGVEVAYNTALSICRDPAAPAQARASATRSLLEVGDLLNVKGRETANSKEPAAMTADEISATLGRLRSELVARAKPTETAPRGQNDVDSAFD